MIFEYKVSIITSTYRSELETILNDKGLEGWELIHADNSKFIFKREKK
jgi:hypothetical protein